VHPAAAVLALLLPGLRLVHDGQTTGRRLRTSNHLRRRAPEPIDRELETFYRRLLVCMQRPEVRDGQWQLLRAQAAWDGNQTCGQFIAYQWQGPEGRLLIAVNYGPRRGQCYLPLPDLASGGSVTLRDLIHPRVTYERAGPDLAQEGLYLDVPAWHAHVFEVTGTCQTRT
jgi:hypothetical protein